MSRLAAAALRRSVVASRDPFSSLLAATAPASARLFSADASGEVAASAADSQNDPFLKSSSEGLAYGRFYSNIGGGNRIEKNMLKTDILHHLDRCGLSLDDVKIDYNRGFTPLGALLRFPSKAAFTTAIRQTSQIRLYKMDMISRDVWDLKQSFDGKAVLLQGVPRNALPEDIERFLCGTNFEPPPFESFLRPGVPEPIKMVLVKFRTKTDAMNAFITKNKSFCLNNQVSMRVLQ
ncbi:hypothetical protein SEVIR_9G450800v4 [Setaria viridis]|uniref:Uncharacterized protein n=2 Tax=Setaria TaxID=4554 RepID=A0A368SSF3_SETIT|nr:uncharacterized protein LOC101782959 [Setaria italica]XP_034571734.1 uncharacterized protein LOC117836419 [Setaria viridis]RCV45347.1 hypothetical protein SETIT_9G446700v2 [Setaria italica]TKV96763.1 hypothetical protein SEVIR_9G450800v2 [Setaria viridis]